MLSVLVSNLSRSLGRRELVFALLVEEGGGRAAAFLATYAFLSNLLARFLSTIQLPQLKFH